MPFDRPGWGTPDPDVDELPDDGKPKPEIGDPVDEDEIIKPYKPNKPPLHEQPPMYMSGWVIS